MRVLTRGQDHRPIGGVDGVAKLPTSCSFSVCSISSKLSSRRSPPDNRDQDHCYMTYICLSLLSGPLRVDEHDRSAATTQNVLYKSTAPRKDHTRPNLGRLERDAKIELNSAAWCMSVVLLLSRVLDTVACNNDQITPLPCGSNTFGSNTFESNKQRAPAEVKTHKAHQETAAHTARERKPHCTCIAAALLAVP